MPAGQATPPRPLTPELVIPSDRKRHNSAPNVEKDVEELASAAKRGGADEDVDGASLGVGGAMARTRSSSTLQDLIKDKGASSIYREVGVGRVIA